MSMEADGPAATIDAGDVLDAVTVEHVEEHAGLAVTDAADEPERHPERAPVPRDVECAAARQDRPVGHIPVEAERAEEQGLRRLARSQPGERLRPPVAELEEPV